MIWGTNLIERDFSSGRGAAWTFALRLFDFPTFVIRFLGLVKRHSNGPGLVEVNGEAVESPMTI
jgi:hypothetical protein